MTDDEALRDVAEAVAEMYQVAEADVTPEEALEWIRPDDDNPWPAAWDSITPDRETGPVQIAATTMVEMGPLRVYNETVYINADAGRETGENRDLWAPLEVYLTDSSVRSP